MNNADIPEIMIAIFAKAFSTVVTDIFPTMPESFDNSPPTRPRAAIIEIIFITDSISASFDIYGDTFINAAVIIANPPMISARFAMPFNMVLGLIFANSSNVLVIPLNKPPFEDLDAFPPPNTDVMDLIALRPLKAATSAIKTGINFAIFPALLENNVPIFFRIGSSSPHISTIVENIVLIICGRAAIRPFARDTADLISGGSSCLARDGNFSEIIGTSFSTTLPIPPSALSATGITFFPNISTDETMLSIHWSRFSPLAIAVRRFPHDDFIALSEPVIVFSASF